MTDKTKNSAEPKKPTKRNRQKVPGKPKKKAAIQRRAAHARAAELSAIHWMDDGKERRIASASFQRQYIRPDLLAKEARLQQTKWVEYRYLTPLECTERFAGEYIAAYRRAYARHFDPKIARNKQPIATNLGQNSVGEMNSLWMARQLADELGLPYDVFLDALIEGKVAGDKWRQPPQPNQLLSGKHTRARLRSRPTRDEVAERLFRPDWDRRFYTERLDDDPVQAAAMRELRVDVLRASDRPRRLAKYLGIPGLLSEARARTLFDAELVDEAIALRPSMRAGAAAAAAERYVPACFGNRTLERDSPCQNCPVAMDCTHFKRSVTRELIRATGTSDPRLAHKRRLDRERQRKHRRNKRKDQRTAAKR